LKKNFDSVVGLLTPQAMTLDINPLFAGPSGALAVDARIVISRPPAGAGRYDHMAITPDPQHLVQHCYLADGTSLTIRPMRSDDT
jgi:acetyltransferase